jgi:hypothetical protein
VQNIIRAFADAALVALMCDACNLLFALPNNHACNFFSPLYRIGACAIDDDTIRIAASHSVMQ